MILAWLGRIGFLFKSFLYTLVGVLVCETATGVYETNSSPQGALVLLGSYKGGIALLILSMIGLCIYSSWRFWECAIGQGTNIAKSKYSNFFSYRLSPAVSGGVYLSYLVYAITVILNKQTLPQPGISTGNDKHCFPTCWQSSTIGKAGILLVGIGLGIGALIQLITGLRGSFMRDIPVEQGVIRKVVKYTGMVGFIGRGLLFFLICIFFWKLVVDTPVLFDIHQGSFSQALNSIRGNTLGRVVLFITGFQLVVYGIHAMMCVKYRTFPTPVTD